MDRTPIRVLVVSSKYPPEYSGSGHRAHRTYLRLQKKFPVTFEVLCSSVTENTSKVYSCDGVRVTRLASKVLPQTSHQSWDRRTWRDKIALRLNYFSEAIPAWIWLAKRHQQYDLVHVFGNVAVTSAAITFCNKIGKPLIVEISYDADPVPYRPLLVKLFDPQRSGFHPQALIVCISAKLAAWCRARGLTQSIWCRPNPVAQPFFLERNRKAEYRARNSRFADADMVLLNIAKFMPLKNQIFLIEVLKLLPKQYKLLLAGPVVQDGPNQQRDLEYLNAIKTKVRAENLQDRVQIKEGFVEQPAEYMKLADVYVLPSRAEGLGTPMLESICCGVPVVATKMEGVTDQWIKAGENGYLSALDAREFAQKIIQAGEIEQGARDRCANDLISQVGEAVIDQEYFNRMMALAGKTMRDS